MLIELRDITKVYRKGSAPEVRAVQGVSADIARGEFVAIMGPSGSGKSTLMNIIGCLDRPTTGSYRLSGLEVGTLSKNEVATVRNRQIGFVFQQFHLLPGRSALKNVELPLLYSDRTDIGGRARHALDMVGLADRIHHRPGDLSGGEQQRVAIARAVVNGPAILLADEPTGNLDTRSGLEVIALFQRLRAAGSTVVLVTHAPGIAEHADRILEIRDGEVAQDHAVSQSRSAYDALAAHPETTG